MKYLKNAFIFNRFPTYALCIVALLSNRSYGQDSIKKAPPITFSASLNHPNLPRDFFKNKYVVLDFWATWCGPCIASFPHLDSLSRKFSSDSVVFAIISSETKAKVAKFLASRNINAFYLLDSVTRESRSNSKINELYGITAQDFGVAGIPYTVIIDKDNNLIWTSLSSRDLTAYDLSNIIHNNGKSIWEARNILKNKAITQAEQMAKIFAIVKKDTIKENNCSLVTASLPYKSYNMSAGTNRARKVRFVEVAGRPLDFYYSYFTGIPSTRIINSVDINSVYMKYEADTTMNWEEFYKTGLDLISKAYRLKFIMKNKAVTAYDLEIVDRARFKSKTKPLQEASSGHRSSDVTDNELVFSNFELEEIGKGLEEYLNTPVLIADPAYKQLKCDMTIKKGDITALNNFLTINYGLRLKKVKHVIKFTEIIQLPG